MKKALLLCTSASLLFAATDASSESSEPMIKVTPVLKLATKLEKAVYDNNAHDNVDDFYGRVSVGMKANVNNFEGRVLIRAYPSGFGYELLRGIETEDDAVNAVTEDVAKFQIIEAISHYSGELMTFEIGRGTMFNSNASYFGNYTDEGPGGAFTGKGVTGNFFDFQFDYDLGKTCILIGSNDPKLNDGYLRVFQDFNILDKAHVGLGVKNNLPDRVHNSDADLFWNTTVAFDYEINGKVKLFTEIGFTDMSENTDALIPVVAGVTFPLMPVFSKVAVEAEYLNEDDRPTIVLGSSIEKMSSVQWGVNLERELNRHFKVLGGIYSEREASEVALGLKLSVSL